jgi:hypothetical protein
MKDKGRGAEALRLFDFCRRSSCDVHYRPEADIRLRSRRLFIEIASAN